MKIQTVCHALLWSYLMYKQIIRISISRVVFAWDRFCCYFTPSWFMMTPSNGEFSALPAICAGNSPVTGEFSSQMPVTLSFDIFFDLRLKKTSANHRDAGDLRRHRAHCDVTVMSSRECARITSWNSNMAQSYWYIYWSLWGKESYITGNV